jgi:hypothetical protein
MSKVHVVRKARRKTHDSKTKDEGPEAGRGVQLDCLPNAHLVLAILRIVGIGHELCVDQDLRVASVPLLELVVAERPIAGRVVLALKDA